MRSIPLEVRTAVGAFFISLLATGAGAFPQDSTDAAKLPQVAPLVGEVRLWRGGSRLIEKPTAAFFVEEPDRLGSREGRPARVVIDSDLYVGLSGVEAGADQGLSIVRSEKKKLVLKLFRGRVVVESAEADVRVVTPHGAVEGRSAYFLVEATKSSTRIVAIDGNLKVTHDLGALDLKPGETATVQPKKPPVKGPAVDVETDIGWTKVLEEPSNLIRNSGFEEGLGDWETSFIDGRSLVTVDDKGVRGGKKSARIDFSNVDTSRISSAGANGDFSGYALWQCERNKLKPGSRYLLRFWFRAKDYAVDGAKAPLALYCDSNLVGRDGKTFLESPHVTGEWQCARFLLEAEGPDLGLYFPCLKNTGAKSILNGTLWLDDVLLVRLSMKAKPKSP